MDETYDARTRRLKESVRTAVLDLFDHTGSAAFVFDVLPDAGIVVASGTPNVIEKLVRDS